jgi:hypothetical protein
MADKDIETILNESDVILRAGRLYDTVDCFLDRFDDEVSNIQHQVYSFAHGLTGEEIRTLAKTIDYGWLLDFPIAGKRATLYSVAYYCAKKKRGKISDELLKKLAGLDKLQEEEIAYRLYVLGEMKRIMGDLIGGL